jgi:hypothetical protein
MNSLISATNMRQPKNVVHFAKAKIALSGWFAVFFYYVGE